MLIFAPNCKSKLTSRKLVRKLSGKAFKASVSHVNSGHTRSCGCKQLELRSEKRIIHGLARHPIYGAWRNMIQRCYNPSVVEYKNYGGRGISVCTGWRKSVLMFYEWSLLNGYETGLLLDRENNDGNYEPDNCRWVTFNISCQNNSLLRSSNTSGYRGVIFRKKKNLKKPWLARIQWNNIEYKLGWYSTSHQAAEAYNNFVIDNKTNHPLNKV